MSEDYTYVRIDILSTVNKGVVCYKHHIPIVYRMHGLPKDHQILGFGIHYHIVYEWTLFFFKTTDFFLLNQNNSLKITLTHISMGKNY